jgi:ATP/maltotriose-dependent transcriptional regulator MalT
LQCLAADLCLDAGNVEGAKAWLEAHERWLAWSGSVLGQADGRLAWARWHLAARNPDQARIAASEALALAASPHQPLVTLGGHRLLGEIAIGEHDLARAERHLTSALELAMTCETPFEQALTLLALAELRAVQGEVGEARRLLEEVRALCLPLGAAPTLARVDALAARLAATRHTEINAYGLTQREFDVLRLVVAGRSNQAIADELFISRDTARTHVANIFRKLDVSTRAEAVDSAHRHGLLSASSSSSR